MENTKNNFDKYLSLAKQVSSLPDDSNAPIKILSDKNTIKNWQIDRQAKLTNASKNPRWADIGIICEDPYVVILRDLVEFPGGFRGGYIRLYNRAYLEGGAAGVVTLPARDGKVLLMHNFRHATRAWHWEIPRGFGEPGIAAEDQARAEVREEIGVEVDELVDLGLYFNNTGLEGNPITLFLARITQEPVPNPEISVDQLRWVPVEELESMITSAEITDGFTIAAYTRAKLRNLI